MELRDISDVYTQLIIETKQMKAQVSPPSNKVVISDRRPVAPDWRRGFESDVISASGDLDLRRSRPHEVSSKPMVQPRPCGSTENTIHQSNAGLMLGHRLRRWPIRNQHWINVSCLLNLQIHVVESVPYWNSQQIQLSSQVLSGSTPTTTYLPPMAEYPWSGFLQ